MPTTTTAKITCRLVPDQDPEKVQQLIKSHIERNAPAGVTVDVKLDDSSAKAYKVSPDHPLIQKAAKSYTKAFEKETVFVRMGGSIPVVEWIDEIFNMPVIIVRLGTPDDRLHSPNERSPLDSFAKGMETLAY